MPKALLINPPPEGLVGKKTRKFNRRFPPLSLLITASILREQGWQVEVNDLHANPLLSSEAVQNNAKSSDLVVLTTNPYADWQCPSLNVQAIFEFAQSLPGDRLIITGNHGTHYPGSVLKSTQAHIVVREEPEWAIVEIAKAMNDGRGLTDIAGISFQDQGEIVHNPQGKLSHMDEFPRPAYDLVDLAHYHYELLGGHFALLEASRGCPYSCNFCNPLRCRSVQLF